MPKCEYIELHTPDSAKAKEFYGSLFGWEFTDMPGDQPYAYFTDGGKGAGGVIATRPGEAPNWLPYITVDDLAESLKKAGELGAEIVFEKTEVPTMGWFGVIKDTAGATLAMWQDA